MSGWHTLRNPGVSSRTYPIGPLDESLKNDFEECLRRLG